MSKVIKYGKTPQFRDVIRAVKYKAGFTGFDENNEPIYDFTKAQPTIKFKGSVKLHGTNAAVCYNDNDGIWYQSRNNKVSTGHFGFVDYMQLHDNRVNELFDLISLSQNIDTSKCTIIVYGEWAGKGIQNNVAINRLEKKFYIFAIKISPCCNSAQFDSYYIKDLSFIKNNKCYDNIFTYPTYEIDIDFNNPGLSSEKLEELTLIIGDQCPVAETKNVTGIGEGIVWIGYNGDERLLFKTKDNRHSNNGVSKKQKVAPIDPDVLKNIVETANKYTTIDRIHQAVEVLELGFEKRHTGKVLDWVKNDIMSEESLSIKESNLNTSLLVKEIMTQTKNKFFKIIDNG